MNYEPPQLKPITITSTTPLHGIRPDEMRPEPAKHRNRIGLLKKPVNLVLVSGTKCNVECKTCPVGRKEYQPAGTMTLDTLERILNKVGSEARVIQVCMYYFNEPFLIPWLADMVKMIHDHGYPAHLSSNMVLWKNVPSVLTQAPETLLLSMSGFTQAVYERSHKNGDIAKVMANMKEIARTKSPKTHVQVSWHRYAYNEHELPLMKEYAESLGFSFVPYATSLLPHTRAMKVWATGIQDPAGEDLLINPLDAKLMCEERKHWGCLLQDQVLAVNSEGQYLNCAGRSHEPDNLRGDLFSTTVEDLFQRRKKDPECLNCRSRGGHIYIQQNYTVPLYSVKRYAEAIYRKLRLAGRFPKFSLWATQKWYTRPQVKKDTSMTDDTQHTQWKGYE